MFTGIVTAIGTVASVEQRGDLRLTIACPYDPSQIAIGASSACSGVCLTVIDRESGRIVGSSQYHDYREQAGGSVEIGWTFLARSLWGGSFNREMKRLMLTHAFAAVERVHFIVGEDNVRSRGAMVKIGGVLDDWTDTREMAGGPVRHVRFTIDRVGFASGPLQQA